MRDKISENGYLAALIFVQNSIDVQILRNPLNHMI